MTKKLIPDPPPFTGDFNNVDTSRYLREPPDPQDTFSPKLLDSFAFTTSRPVASQTEHCPSLLAIQPGVSAEDALVYVSRLLEMAALSGDEISLHRDPVERALFWGLLNSVEVARAVVESVLEGSPSVNHANSG